jgi:hypothetical protein
MVMEVGVGDGNPFAGVGDIAESVVVVLVVCEVGGQVTVVDPDILGVLDPNGVTVCRKDLADLEVAQDHVGLVLDIEADAGQG